MEIRSRRDFVACTVTMDICIALFFKYTCSATIYRYVCIVCLMVILIWRFSESYKDYQVRRMPFTDPFILQVHIGFFLYSVHAKLPNLNPTSSAF